MVNFEENSPALSGSDLARYSRQMILPEFGRAGQEKLARARVLVVGAGGLGSPAALYLAAAGVGTLGLADFDTVAEHNLHRQVLHDSGSIGLPKLDSAAGRLRGLNPAVSLELHRDGISPENARELFSKYDVIVDGSDNFPARYLSNDAAFFAGKPVAHGCILRFEGQVSFFDTANGGPCYRCLFPEIPPPGSTPNCAEAGVVGALCGVIGSLQAMEAIKFLIGAGENLVGRLVAIDTLTMRFRELRLKKDPGCPLCGTEPTVKQLDPDHYRFSCATEPEPPMSDETCPLEIDVEEAARLFGEGDAVLLDVREPFEVDICRIEGSLTIPIGEVGERHGELPRDKRVLVHCHHGGRSLEVTRFLRQKGIDRVSNVAGGIDAWAEKIDPSLARY